MVRTFSSYMGLSLRTPVLPSSEKPTLPRTHSIWNAWAHLSPFLRTIGCVVAKQIRVQNIIYSLELHARMLKYTKTTNILNLLLVFLLFTQSVQGLLYLFDLVESFRKRTCRP